VLSSEFCISVDRIKENAVTFGRSYESELHRVIIHGVLHLIGFDDHSDEDRKVMREKEEEALVLLTRDYETRDARQLANVPCPEVPRPVSK
jgi:rRNA maturation RNase YbeY